MEEANGHIPAPPLRYAPEQFEAKWRARWRAADLFRTLENPTRERYYALDFFPYPSGSGLSVGHCRNYVPTDVLARMKRMQGFNVLHPMGFDAFGLPAENEAIKKKARPAQMIAEYGANYRRQMDLIGVSYDWSRSFASSDPSYYRWTQWLFELLYRRGLAYQTLAAVNWDPIDKTVLADEEVIAGRAERSGALVETRLIPQWFFKITEYAQRLIDDLELVDWPEGIKQQQRNWIGRSEGVQFELKIDLPYSDRYDLDVVDAKIEKGPLEFDVFTTRIDTVFGVTFCVLAPEHPVVDLLLQRVESRHQTDVAAYRDQTRTISDVDRLATNREKTGVFTGAYAINPANGKRVPIWIADYVLATYGTGAIMAVPGHDARDYAFAIKFGLDIVQVIAPSNETQVDGCFEASEGVLVNSGEYNGLTVGDAQKTLGEWIEALGIGTRKIQYRLRDWLISRQRYWGCPIPVIHSKSGETQLVPEDCLPVLLPDVESYEPTGDGRSPLAEIKEFVNVTDIDGRMGMRETDTMGGFACSSWYFLRFCDPHNSNAAWNPEVVNEWMPVDCYVGGAEHAVMHLLYARFFTKVLYDAGLVKSKEPFQSLRNQGQVLAHTPYRKPREDENLEIGEEGILVSFEAAERLPKDQVFYRWKRMSKSKGNVVTPDEVVESNGADALRLYLLFRAPFDADIEWENKGVEDLSRFLSRIFRLIEQIKTSYRRDWKHLITRATPNEASKSIRRTTHQTIRNVTQDIERFGFNTYVSWLMKFVNSLSPYVGAKTEDDATSCALSESADALILLLSPGAPHSSDELWEILGYDGFTIDQAWPEFSEQLAKEETVTIALQVNGKLRGTVDMPIDAPKEEMERIALEHEKVRQHLGELTIRKVVVVPGKLVNVVAG